MADDYIRQGAISQGCIGVTWEKFQGVLGTVEGRPSNLVEASVEFKEVVTFIILAMRIRVSRSKIYDCGQEES